jgi:hypothetical protein
MSLKLIVALHATATLTITTFGTVDAAAKKSAKKLVRPSARVLVVRPVDPCAVYWAGTYVGRDCDPNIRGTLIREFQFRMNNR